MKLYYVEKIGIYSQGIYGIFDDGKLALRALKKAKQKENDNYHTFHINVRELNKCGYEDIESKEPLAK